MGLLMWLRTGLLMAILTGLLMGIGYLFGGPNWAFMMFLFSLAFNFITYWYSDKIVLGWYNARLVDEYEAPELYAIVRNLAERAGLPMPRIAIIPTETPNAFATGRSPNNAAVAVTRGLLQSLSREELAGVVAHELAHIRNHDTAIMTVTATFAGAISMLANFALFFGGRRENGLGIVGTIAMMFLAPIAAALVQMAISRTREYAADKAGAEICGHPLWLASALQRIQAGAASIDNVAAERNPATAHMFIINPLHAHKRDSLFATHPATENRVAALQQMAGPGAGSPRRAASSSSKQPSKQPWGRKSETRGSGGKAGPWG